jgi:hypothetical protein
MDMYWESASWRWGVSLSVATITIRAIGVVSMALGMVRTRPRLELQRLGLLYVVPVVIGLVSVIGLLLTVLHGIEAAIWATAYLWLGALNSPFDAMLFSVGSMTTAGAPGLMLQRGVLEGANGALLFGISTAYIFGVMQVYWQMLRNRT